MIRNAVAMAFGILGLLAWAIGNAAGSAVPPATPPTAEDALQRLREVCARHNQIPATDRRSCIDCPFGQQANRSTGQCVEPAPAKPVTAEEALQRLRERCARHNQVPATDGKSCIACAFGQHADPSTGQCAEPAKTRGKR